MHEICGDVPLSRKDQLRYLAANLARNLRGLRYPSHTVFWHCRYVDHGSASPLRSYLDAFMRDMLPQIIPPKRIHVLDIGCGTAYMRGVLANAGYSGVYTGIDVVREPKLKEDADPAFSMTFIQQRIEDFVSADRFDLVISNTSLEHISDDFGAVVKAHDVVKGGGAEIHIVPTYWSLPLYLWHGYRQYTPARIRTMFRGTDYTIYRLGGFASFLFHLCIITISERLLGLHIREKSIYPRMKALSNRFDRFLSFGSGLYAVVVKHE